MLQDRVHRRLMAVVQRFRTRERLEEPVVPGPFQLRQRNPAERHALLNPVLRFVQVGGEQPDAFARFVRLQVTEQPGSEGQQQRSRLRWDSAVPSPCDAVAMPQARAGRADLRQVGHGSPFFPGQASREEPPIRKPKAGDRALSCAGAGGVFRPGIAGRDAL